MNYFLESFGEQVSGVFDPRDVFDLDDCAVDAVSDVMHPDVHVLHTQVKVGVVSARNRALIVAKQ